MATQPSRQTDTTHTIPLLLVRDKESSQSQTDFSHSPEDQKLQQQDATLKTRVRIFRFIARVLTLFLAASTTGTMIWELTTYLTTKDTIRGGRSPWAAGTQLWPTILLLIISAISSIYSLAVLVSYRHGISAANAVAKKYAKFDYTITGIHVIIWIVVAILYRTGNSGKDLWGFACSPIATDIQPDFEGVVNFQKVCDVGKTSSIVSIANAILQILTVAIIILEYRRSRYKKAMGPKASNV